MHGAQELITSERNRVMAQNEKTVTDLLLALLPWWVPAVLADAAYFAPNIAVQFYPPTKSELGLPVYTDFVMTVESLSPYVAAVLLICALVMLALKTMRVRKKAHHSVKKATAKSRTAMDSDSDIAVSESSVKEKRDTSF